MWAFLPDIAKAAVGLLNQVFALAVPPVRVEIHHLAFDQLRNSPGDSLVLITPYPTRYYAEISLTNRKDRAVYVRDVRLRVCEMDIVEPRRTRNMRLEPHERRTLRVVFPVDDAHASRTEEPFSITVAPTAGRATKTTGTLPMSTDSR